MTKLEPTSITESRLRDLRSQLARKPETFGLLSDPEFTAWLVSIGIAREVGSENDELARFLFDADTDALVPRSSLKAEVIQRGTKVGVRILSTATQRLDVRIRGFRDLCVAHLSENVDGTYHQLVFFPELIAQIAALHGVELMVVQTWAANSIFGGFDRNKGYYETNFWELEKNDSVRFAALLQKHQLALLGTHDLIAHVAGLRSDVWPRLERNAVRVISAIESYLEERTPSIADLVLPYTAGVILDDLAQPPSYDSPSHTRMLDAVLEVLKTESRTVAPAILVQYPASFESVIRLSRRADLTVADARSAARQLADEIKAATAYLSA